MGPPNTVLVQNNNLYGAQDDFSKVIRSHTFKFGGAYHTDKVDIAHADNASDGDFSFNGEETGIDFADSRGSQSSQLLCGHLWAGYLASEYPPDSEFGIALGC